MNETPNLGGHPSRRTRAVSDHTRGDIVVTVGADALSGAWNFRDIAEETGVLPGRFFRSSELSALDDSGRAVLHQLGITDVADLRSNGEVIRRGAGQVPDDVSIHRLAFRELGTDAPHEKGFDQMMARLGEHDSAAAAIQFMTEEYRQYPGLAGAQAAVKQVISLLAAGRPVLTHCFAGKDRTGFTVAVVLEAAGLERDPIIADYMRSNDAITQLRHSIRESYGTGSDGEPTQEVTAFAEARLADEVLGVREEYLDAARRALDDRFGSLTNYLEAIGVTGEDVLGLRAALR